MKLEKFLTALPAQALTSDGGEYGQISIPSTRNIKVSQIVRLYSSVNIEKKPLQVKLVINETNIIVGPVDGERASTFDARTYTVATGAMLDAAEQARFSVLPDVYNRSVYEEEPTSAIRTFLVDYLGREYTAENPLPVTATINVDQLTVDIENPGIPAVANVEVEDADEELSFVFPTNTKRFQLKVRGGDAKIRIAYSAGDTDSNFFTNEMGNVYHSGDIDPLYPLTIYFSCSKADRVIEILSWANTA